MEKYFKDYWNKLGITKQEFFKMGERPNAGADTGFDMGILALKVAGKKNGVSKLHGAVFVSQIGGELASGQKHDGRAPDYDDWSLNGDILVYYPVLDIALELSSMGIRVDEDALESQLALAGCEERKELPFQKAILEKELPYTIGGGIGQSRICMFFLRKAHIGEVQVSIWPQEDVDYARECGVIIL